MKQSSINKDNEILVGNSFSKIRLLLEKYLIISLFVSSLVIGNIYASEPILITISSDLDKIIFDGKWTHTTEWKPTSENTLRYDDGTQIHLRTAHQDGFVYVFLDLATDMVIDKGADNALICFDGKNDKTDIPGIDDYCFSTSLSRKISFTYQGDGIIGLNGHFQKISNPVGYVAIGNVSDKHDRYNIIPHVSYEFRIPIDVLGRSHNYGFYMAVFEANSGIIYSWPTEVQQNRIFTIPSPSEWGEITSPDKSMGKP